MNEYILTIQDEPDNPIILTQDQFDIIYEAGIEPRNEKTLLIDKQSPEENLNIFTNNMVRLGDLEPKDQNKGYYYNGESIPIELVKVNFEKGIRTIIQNFLNNHMIKD